jgi:hypothetical protein
MSFELARASEKLSNLVQRANRVRIEALGERDPSEVVVGTHQSDEAFAVDDCECSLVVTVHA